MGLFSAMSPIGTFRGIVNGQMDSETEGKMGRKFNSWTYKLTDTGTTKIYALMER